MREHEQRLKLVGAGPAAVAAVAGIGAHFERLVALGRHTLPARLDTIVREARAGRYRRFGTGIRSNLRDIFRRD
ncbi:MAG: hypothetical protein AB1832_02385 [Pseudomonadota bacterium]